MIRTYIACTVCASLIGLATSASALTVANRDTGEHTVKITNGGKTTEYKIAPLDSVEEACEKACLVELVSSPAAAFRGKDSDEVLILNQQLIKGGE